MHSLSTSFLELLSEFALMHNQDPSRIVVQHSEFESYELQTAWSLRLPSDLRTQLLNWISAQPLIDHAALTGPGFLSVRTHPQFWNPPPPIDSQTWILDYCGINIAKRMHIGHLRSILQGDALSRLLRQAGHRVILQNHVGDWGNALGPLLLAWQQEGPASTLDELTSRYQWSVYQYQTNPDFQAQSLEVSRELLTHQTPERLELWSALRTLSLTHLQHELDFLGSDLQAEDVRGESFYLDRARSLISRGLHEGWARRLDDGAILAGESFGTPLILQKSNGNVLYATLDLAAIEFRVQTYCPTGLLYCVDRRQSDHFQSVFQLARHIGILPESTLAFHWSFGSLLNEHGQPLKTKSGSSPSLLQTLESSFSDFLNSSPGSTPSSWNEFLRFVRFQELKRDRQSDYAWISDSFFPPLCHKLTSIDSAVSHLQSLLKSQELSKSFSSSTPDLPRSVWTFYRLEQTLHSMLTHPTNLEIHDLWTQASLLAPALIQWDLTIPLPWIERALSLFSSLSQLLDPSSLKLIQESKC